MHKPLFLAATLTVFAALAMTAPVHAQSSLFTYGWQSLNNSNSNLNFLDFQSSASGAAINTAGAKSFSGLDGAGNPQTMSYSGTSYSLSSFGKLHSSASASLINSYYNATNSAYVAANGGVADPKGSPTSLASSATSIFTDTLQFGGTALQNGYTARYIFHIDGPVTGTNAFGVLGVDVGSENDTTGIFSTPTDWATKSFAINGVTPQSIKVQLDAATIFDTPNLTDGLTYSGAADFSSTATLTGIEVLDSLGNHASGWTVTASSGTRYNTLQASVAAPEPGTLCLLAYLAPCAFITILRRRRN